MYLHGRDSYGYDTDVAGYLLIQSFTMASATTAFGQRTVHYHTRILRIGLRYLSVISVMNRILSAIVRICAYRIGMAFSNLLLRIPLASPCCVINALHYWLGPGSAGSVPTRLKNVDWDVKPQYKQTNYMYIMQIYLRLSLNGHLFQSFNTCN